ncbi:23S rRNA (pseudouridine(1915)-N(3))-methyltransferase RlmH [Alcaligenaceae bacterium]|nr:23S rRNA (pseudouridine(1915)-N(3))-methyltransferase RlmH [Alcaligenaceae bacterium]
MKLIVIAVGQRMPAWVQTAWQDYAKRLPADCALDLKEIKPEPRTSGKTTAQMMLAEAQRIEAAIPTGALRIALDERGKDLTTVDLSRQLENWRSGGQDIALIVGGPDGLDSALKQSCHSLIRLSSLTLPHPMVRVLLAEQLYRAWAIMTNHPYHRA